MNKKDKFKKMWNKILLNSCYGSRPILENSYIYNKKLSDRMTKNGIEILNKLKKNGDFK